MKTSTKILLWTLGLGILYAIFKLFTGRGGEGLEDSIDTLEFVSLLISALAFGIIILNIRRLNQQIVPIIFLLISLPGAFEVIETRLDEFNQNRTPELTPKYSRPIKQTQYWGDSLLAKNVVDSIVALKNRTFGGPDIKYAAIDTIIYSPEGRKVFIIYYKKYDQNEVGADLIPDYLFGGQRTPERWNLEEGTSGAVTLGGNYHELNELKMAVRKFYFNNYSFNPGDTSKGNYFWRHIP